jgi:hypothetical protein
MSADRYLNTDAKADELSHWQRVLAERAGVAGVGNPDPEMVPWCERINAINGVCTLQSCAGHEHGEGGSRSSGHLWLWLAAEKAIAFQERAFELARHAAIERISTIYQPWGREVVQIEFRGTPDGQLESSGQAILAFLASL